MDKKQTHFIYGLASGASLVIFGLIIYLTNTMGKTWVGLAIYIPFLVFTILNAKAYSKANHSAVTFGNVFTSGLKLALIASIIMVAWSTLSIFIFPEMKEKAMEIARESMAKNPNVTDETMEMGLSMTKKFYTPILIFGSLIGNMFYGCIFSLIGAAIAPKNGIAPTGDNF